MTRIPTSRSVLVIVGGAVLATASAWLLATNLSRTPMAPQILTASAELSYAVENADAVVVVSGIRSDGTIHEDGWGYRMESFDILRVPYQAATSLSELRVGEDLRARYGETAESNGPDLAGSTAMDAHEVVSLHGSPVASTAIREVDPDAEYVLLLNFVDRRLFPEHPTDWIVTFIGLNELAEEAEFPHTNGAQWASDLQQLGEARAALDTMTLERLLAEWLREVDLERQ